MGVLFKGLLSEYLGPNLQELLNNLQILQGDLVVDDAFEAACESFIDPPQVCRAAILSVGSSTDTKTIVLIVFVMFILTCLIMYFYRRMQRREMTKEMSMQINAMVSQYFELSENRNTDDI